jgi:transposase-like protein
MGNDERIKLTTLLNYWIEHNREHGQEFREWAEKAEGLGETEVAKEIQEAVKEMDKASELLSQALSRLKGREG